MDNNQYVKKYDYEVATAVVNNPLELYDKNWDDSRQFFFLRGKLGPAGGFLFGCFYQWYSNYNNRRPFYAGIHMYFVYGIPLAYIMYRGRKELDRYLGDRDAVYSHYIHLHPEDFPPPPRVKIGDMFQPWVPIR